MNRFKLTIFFSSLTFLTSSLFFSTTLPMKGESVLEEINRTGILKVGIRGDAIPFGYRSLEGKLEGICFDLVHLIEQEITKKIDRNLISTKLLISSTYNRFDIVDNKVVHLECGPNTIREVEEYQITFSQPFFISGVRFIAKKDLAKKLVNSQGKNFRIGVLRYTSTEILIKEKFPQAEFEYFQGNKGASRAFQAMTRGQIDAFVDDSILLIGESVAQRFPLGETTEYVLTPDKPLSCEEYGFILPIDNPDWVNLVNSVINSPEILNIYQGWFDAFPSESFSNLDQCAID